MRSMSRLLAASALALSVTASGLAFGADPSTAEHLFQQGLEAMKRSQFKEACDAFAGSNEADASPGTQINLALCNEKQNKLATAWGWYRTAAGLADLRAQKDRAELARAEASKLEPKLHKLVITVKHPAEGLTVTRNGSAVPGAVLGSDVPIDPGDYVIEVTAKRKKPWTQTVRIVGTPGIDRVEVPALEDAPAEAAVVPSGTPGPDGNPSATGRDGSSQRNIGLVLGGTGIIAGGIAVALQFLAINVDDKADALSAEADKLPAGPDRTRLEDSEASRRKAASGNQLGALVTGGGAVVLIGVGITLILTAPSGSKSAALKKPLVFPLVGNGTAGLGLHASF